MSRKIRSDAELQEAAAHVRYEIDMLIYCAEDLSASYSSPPSTLATPAKNMALEAFLLHYRNLRAFLCPNLQKRVADDDIFASDFLKESTARDLADGSKLALHKDRLDGMVSHLTYRRIRYIAAGNHLWNVADMLTTMLLELQVFFGNLPPAMVSWFPDASFFEQVRRSRVWVPTVPGPP